MKSLFLHGYGLSIKVKDTRLVFSQGNIPFSEKKEVFELPSSACPFDKVVIQGNGFVSTEALQRLSESNINVVMLDKRGKLYSYFHKIGGHQPLIRQNQYDAFRDPKKLEFLRKWILSQKIESQIQLFKEFVTEPKKFYSEYNKAWQISNNQRSGMNYSLKANPDAKLRIRKAIVSMEQAYSLLASVRELREIMKIESDVAKWYYPTFCLLFKSELRFNSRNNARTFRPKDASDVINALLNYGFGILYTEVTKQLNILGLDCYVGFYHKNHESHLALVYDMIEPFRHLVDRSAFEIQDQIRKKDYVYSREGIVVLSDELKQKYIELLSTIFDRKRDYKARTGIRRKDGYQRMEEITIMKMKCIELKDLLENL
ncbi:MAG: CRISPR-associated endonuclease Cas1 [Thaumarchaeota archaeon]|nr:CRISPR-associated endonuclease Cas1 [Nitrososphaerota archaeon]MDE1867820.1 CRISPR-associated endonuclease Cas1 [Nitrososphaerota archaeon]